MVSVKLHRLVAVIALLLPLLSCDNRHELPPPGEPDLEVDGRAVNVEPSLWRNFFPGGSAPDGDPLVVYIRLWAPDSLPLPSELRATRAWVVNGMEVWATDLTRDDGWMLPFKAGFHADGGPKWEPEAYADVTVRVVLPDGGTRHVLVPHCQIMMAW